MTTYNFLVSADYHQFYIQDQELNPANSEHSWTEEEIVNRLSVCPYSIGISTFRQGDVPVQINVLHDFNHNIKPQNWDAIGNSKISIPSRKLVLIGPFSYLPDCPIIPLSNQRYKVQIYYYGENTISEDGLDGEDYYRIYLIPLAN